MVPTTAQILDKSQIKKSAVMFRHSKSSRNSMISISQIQGVWLLVVIDRAAKPQVEFK